MNNIRFDEYDAPPRRLSKRHKRNALKTASRTHFALMVYLALATAIISVIAAVLMIMYSPEKAAEILNDPYVTWTMQVVVMYIIAFPVYFLLTRGLQKPLYEKRKLAPGEFTVSFFIGTAIMIFGSLISSLISMIITLNTGSVPDSSLDSVISGTPLWIIILVVVIIGPIFEELIFRKIMLDRLSVYGDRMAIVVSAVSFGLFHGNIEQLIYATGLGLLLGYLYTRTRNIKYPIFMHMLINFFGSVPSLLLMERYAQLEERLEKYGESDIMSPADQLMQIQISLDSISVTIIQYGFAIVGLVLFVVLTAMRAYKVPNGCMVKLPGFTKFRVAFMNLGYIIFLLYSIVMIALSTFPELSAKVTEALIGVM